MELAVDQIKKRSFDYHAFLPEVMNILVIGKRNIQEFAAKFGLITEVNANKSNFEHSCPGPACSASHSLHEP